MSSIGAVGASYYQNHRDLAAYCNALDRNVLPIARGADLDIDDLLRRSVIHALMCRFALDMRAVEDQYAIDFDSYFEAELEQLETLARDGLIELGGGWIRVTPRGRLLVRNVAMVFDRGLRAGAKRARYSKVI
jgi:oxygen-independent coproporphyrinogen-3 oxidase